MRRVKAMDTDLIFVSKHPNAPHDFRHGFNEARKMAGLEDVTFHTLRHTSCSRLAGLASISWRLPSMPAIDPLSMTRRYSHHIASRAGRIRSTVNAFFERGSHGYPHCTSSEHASQTSRPAAQTKQPDRHIGGAAKFIQHLDQRTRTRPLSERPGYFRGKRCVSHRAMNSPSAVRDYLRLKLAPLEHEEFHVIWLDAQNRIIAFDRLFPWCADANQRSPREVVKAGLAHNAAAVILAA